MGLTGLRVRGADRATQGYRADRETGYGADRLQIRGQSLGRNCSASFVNLIRVSSI